MSKSPGEVERFSVNIEILIDALIDANDTIQETREGIVNPELVSMALGFIKKCDGKYLIDQFIKNSEKFWDQIYDRSEIFFIKEAGTIFGNLPIKATFFKDLIECTDENGENIITDETKTEIWDILHSLVKISIRYIHKGRNPYSYLSDGEYENAYDKEFFDSVDLGHHADVWDLDLDFPKEK